MSSSESESKQPDGLDALWTPVREQPEDESRHRAFVTYAVESGRYLEAIERYKTLAKVPGFEALAKSWQDRVATQVATKLLTKPADAAEQAAARTRKRSVQLIVVGLVFAGFAGLTWGRPFSAMGLVFGLPLVATGLVVYSRAKSK